MTEPRLRRGAGRQRGTTLIEILVSLMVLVIGMLGLYKAIGSATKGTQSAQRFIQAQARAQAVIEAIRNAPSKPTDTLTCLKTAATLANWQACEAQCLASLQTLSAQASNESCAFVTLSKGNPNVPVGGVDKDRSLQQYAVIFRNDDLTRSSAVVSPPAGLPCFSGCNLWDIQVTVGWNDDGTAPLPGTGRSTTVPDHSVTLRQIYFR